MTSPAWVIVLHREKASKANEILWVASQTWSHLHNSLLCQWSVETKQFVGFSLSLSQQLLPALLFNFHCNSLVSVFVTSLHLSFSLHSSSLPPVFLAHTHTLKTHFKTQILFPAPGFYNRVLIKSIRLYIPALIVP